MWRLTCFPVCAVVSAQPVAAEEHGGGGQGVHTRQGAVLEDVSPVLKLALLFADGKMLVHALIFFCMVQSDI